MRYLPILLTALLLTSCSWETYQNSHGNTALRPKYESGTRIYYEDGTYSGNMRNNQFRPEQRTVKPLVEQDNVRGTHWQ